MFNIHSPRKPNWRVIGTMSGTSCDGLDLCLASFTYEREAWHFKIEKTGAISFPSELETQLQQAHQIPAQDLLKLDAQLGQWMGERTAEWIIKEGINPANIDGIGHHGHTVFHQPKNGFTFQIGKGAAIAAATGIPTISDFRSTDLCFGGQGAPLVPIGDQLLFGQYSHRLNIGGVCNLSFEDRQTTSAGDVCIGNMALNFLSQKCGKKYDEGGLMAKSGKLDESLFQALNAIPFLHKPFPKSMGKEEFEQHYLPALKASPASIPDQLTTVCEHIAQAIQQFSPKPDAGIITGGGAFNDHLIQRIQAHTKHGFVIPDPEIIEFKEALLFAFLGVLYLNNIPSSFPTTTGASKSVVNGCLYLNI
ncbi:MAG: anhydro-N-acetylmuramic acid kinase [Luteibaculaceae bacterium]|jgi:anhydro-N-acetylmuramic acid kinase